jgi:hypothetical protein
MSPLRGPTPLRKSEARNPKFETNLKLKGAMTETGNAALRLATPLSARPPYPRQMVNAARTQRATKGEQHSDGNVNRQSGERGDVSSYLRQIQFHARREQEKQSRQRSGKDADEIRRSTVRGRVGQHWTFIRHVGK